MANEKPDGFIEKEYEMIKELIDKTGGNTDDISKIIQDSENNNDFYSIPMQS